VESEPRLQHTEPTASAFRYRIRVVTGHHAPAETCDQNSAPRCPPLHRRSRGV